MTRRRLHVLIAGLSGESVWRQVARDEINVVDSPALVRAALHA